MGDVECAVNIFVGCIGIRTGGRIIEIGDVRSMRGLQGCVIW